MVRFEHKNIATQYVTGSLMTIHGTRLAYDTFDKFMNNMPCWGDIVTTGASLLGGIYLLGKLVHRDREKIKSLAEQTSSKIIDPIRERFFRENVNYLVDLF